MEEMHEMGGEPADKEEGQGYIEENRLRYEAEKAEEERRLLAAMEAEQAGRGEEDRGCIDENENYITMIFEVFGNPVAQSRPRFFRRGSIVGTYEPSKSKKWKRDIRLQVLSQRPKFLEGAIELKLNFYFSRPKTLPKKVTHHVKKPDLDNLIKAVKDALKGLCYRDDSQIIQIIATKEYTFDAPKVRINIGTVTTPHD
jgi:Holliday junction resolvase RusA-like endonuclease